MDRIHTIETKCTLPQLKAIITEMSTDYDLLRDETYYTSTSMHSSDSESRDSSSISSDYIDKIKRINGVDVNIHTNFVNLDGLHPGVPTRTTPTLTPTTLRNIEQSMLYELQVESESHENEAGFVPPVVQPSNHGGSTYMSLVDSKSWQGGTTSISDSVSSGGMSMSAVQTTTTRRNMGGRRPAKNNGISPEEQERRVVRRERNKMAAARCRKRRMDHTNELIMETEGLETKKQGLQHEIQELQSQKEELEFLLEAHKACCTLHRSGGRVTPPDIKPLVFKVDKRMESSSVKHEAVPTSPSYPFSHPTPAKRPMLGTGATGGTKPHRPTSLFVPSHSTLMAAVSVSEVAGIPITTPSAGLPLNFASMMEGGTGLTPVSAPLIPSCSSQQRNSGFVDLSSPESGPGKLVSL